MNLDVPKIDQFQTREEYIELVNNRYDSLKMLASLARHDTKNLVEELNYYHGLHKNELPKEYNIHYQELMGKIEEAASLLSSSPDIEFNFIRLLIPVLHNTELTDNVDIQCDPIKIKTDIRFFVSVITNILNNAKEAYIRKYDTMDELVVSIRTDGGYIIFEDNAGGFDVDKIQYGVTLKKIDDDSSHYHGFFLKTMLEKCHLFNLDFKIQRIDNGTRILVGINKGKETLNDKSDNKYLSTD
jgi:uncharacterized protein (UPF0335 family)